MNAAFERVAEIAKGWGARPGMPNKCVGIAGTVCHMAHRLATSSTPDLTGEKSLKVVGCYLCRQIGEAVCSIPKPEDTSCPLGFESNLRR
jgi:hypothetical protein